MSKKIKSIVKLQIPAGQANPAPPVGSVLGQQGVNIMEFCNAFNEKTRPLGGVITPVVITIYEDRSFTFITKQPPASVLIKKMLGIEKGSSAPNKDKVGKITQAQLAKIAEEKMPDLNAHNINQAKKIIAGSARQMGVEIEK